MTFIPYKTMIITVVWGSKAPKEVLVGDFRFPDVESAKSFIDLNFQGGA